MDQNPIWQERQLALLLERLEEMPRRFEALKKHFPEWRDQRLLTMAVIKEFQEKLDKVFQIACIGNGVGSATSLVGTLISIVGAVCSMKGVSGAASWMNAGSKISTVGNIIVPVTVLLDNGFSSYYFKKAQEQVRRDQKLSEPLSEFLNTTRELNDLMLLVFGCSIYSRIGQDLMDWYNEAGNILNDMGEDTENIGTLIQRRREGKIPESIPEEIGVAFRRNFKRMCKSSGAGLLRSLHRLGELLQQPHVIMAISCTRLYFKANELLDDRGIISAMNGTDWKNASSWSKTGHCTFQLLSILTDVANIAICAKEGLRGHSIYTRQLELIKNELQQELTGVENLILLRRYEDNP